MAAETTGTTEAPGTFASPDAAHSPAAYWFWHHLPTGEEIRAQVAQMRAGGYRSFQIQARLAYRIDGYLTDEYLAACADAVAEARRHDMTVGIYDDYNWQSGHAGGRTVAGRDHLRERHVFWASQPLPAGTSATVTIDGIVSATEDLGHAGMAWQYDGARPEWDEWTVVAALVHPPHVGPWMEAVVDVTYAAPLVGSDDQSCTVRVTSPAALTDAAVVTVFVSARAASSRLPNYLLPEAAERFVEVGYQPYFDALEPYFGDTVKYFFFDQPHASYYVWAQRVGNLRSSFLFTPELVARFEQDHGHPFALALLALVHDAGEQTAHLRAAFYATYSQLAQHNFLGVLADWCRSHGVALSGHEVLGHVGSWHPAKAFADWDLRVNFGLDYFGVDSYRDITGVDAQDCVPQLSAKLGDSVARSNGRSGCIVEQYMLGRWPDSYPGDWNLTLQDLRAQAIRLHLAGARQFLFHAFYQTDGSGDDTNFFVNPRFDFAPGINFQPWWAFHREFAEESGRLSTFIDEADPACDIAVLFPLRTAWTEGPHHAYGDHIEFWASHLAETGYAYHFIDERDLVRSSIGDGALRIGGRRYPCLVLPSVTTVEATDTLAALALFAAAGGTIITTGDTPRHVTRGAPGVAAEAWQRLSEASPSVHQFAGLPQPHELADILSPLRRHRPHITAGTSGLWQWAGRDESGWRLAAFNDSDQPIRVTLTTPWPTVETRRWNAGDGTVSPWSRTEQPANGGVPLILQPMELLCLVVREASPATTGEQPAPAAAAAVETDVSEVPLDDDWTLEVVDPSDGSTRTLAVTPTEGWETQGLPAYSGMGVYRRTVMIPQDDGRDWSLVLPGVHTAVEVRLNGATIGRRAWAPFVFPLPGSLLRGDGNSLELRVHNSAGNRYLAGTGFQDEPAPSGLAAAPLLRSSPTQAPDHDR